MSGQQRPVATLAPYPSVPCRGIFGVRCQRAAVAKCPNCGAPLCEECLKRHARFPGAATRSRHALDEGGEAGEAGKPRRQS